MAQQLRSILSVFLIIVLVIVVGVPISYHDCSLRGQHKFQSGFSHNGNEDHCDCCAKTDGKAIACEHSHEGKTYLSGHPDNKVSNTTTSSFTRAACCKIKPFLLRLSIIAQQIFDAIREVAASFTWFLNEIIYYGIKFINEFIPIKNQYSPPEIASQMHSGAFLFTQFLL